MSRFLFDQTGPLTTDLRPAIEAADVVAAHPAHVVAHSLAEVTRTPTATLSVFPAMLPSAHTVPGGSPVGPWSGPAGRVANRMAWANARFVVARLFDRQINSYRHQLGLGRVRAGLFTLPLRAEATLLMAPPELVDPPPDWPDSVTVTGAVSWDKATGEVDDGLRTFLGAGPPPVLVTLGASTAAIPDDFFELAVGALVDLGERVLLVTGPAPAPGPLDPDVVAHRRFVSFDAVLPSCRAVLHHGGVGTMIAAARAGLPQVVVPMGFDQPDTAALIERQGLGIQVPWNRRHRHLAGALRSVLADRTIAARAAAVGSGIRDRDGAACAAEHLEALADLHR